VAGGSGPIVRGNARASPRASPGQPGPANLRAGEPCTRDDRNPPALHPFHDLAASPGARSHRLCLAPPGDRVVTLRLRLVLAIGALVTVAQVAFFAVTYTLYRNSQFDRLDTQLRSSEPVVERQLEQAAGLGDGDQGDRGSGGPDGGREGPPVLVPPGTYGELRGSDGTVLGDVRLTTGVAQPKLPPTLPALSAAGRLFTVDSSSGSGSFRVLAVPHRGETTVIVAIPTTEATNALRRLLLIEGSSVAALLVVLSAGSWLILRHGLRPLERMAVTAHSISGGDLGQRVTPADERSEIGQLGLALNNMLDEIEAAFRQREATEARLRQFLADASHELRTPLTSIRGFAELFRVAGDHPRADLPTMMRRIEQESSRMATLVEELLLLARLDEHRPTARQPVDLAVLGADACSDAVVTAPDRRVTLVAPDPVVVAGDEAHLRQAVANLVTNAIRHTPAGSPIEVTARVEAGEALLVVRDHGPGLDAGALQHAFDRFWQADEARVGSGAGLGLAIVAAVAAEHGGAAEAANAPGGGARFTLRLPREPVGTVV
jgi:two-component system OmpR family sensor kinase